MPISSPVIIGNTTLVLQGERMDERSGAGWICGGSARRAPASPLGPNPHRRAFLQGVVGMSDDPFALGQAGTDFHA